MPTAETLHYLIAVNKHCMEKTDFGYCRHVELLKIRRVWSEKRDLRQKLLDDLRLRREQLAKAHSSQYQGQNPANNNSQNNTAYAHESFDRSSHGKPNWNRPNSGAQKWSRPGHQRSPVTEQSSLLFESPGRSSNSSDMSLALAFAIEDGGKLTNMGSPGRSAKKVISHHLQRSLDFGERSNTKYFSESYRHSVNQLHSASSIRVTSNGTQKLNQILKSRSDEINFNRYPLDVGKELLKGATDLEESLRMLVNLQAASNHKVSTRRTPVIPVEEGEEAAGAIEIYKTKLTDTTIFSVDSPSRNSIVGLREVAANIHFKQHLLEQSLYSTSNSKVNYGKTSPDLVFSRHSISFDWDSKAAILNPGINGRNIGSKELSYPASSAIYTESSNSHTDNSSSKNGNKIKHLNSRSSEQDKGKIPNIIAKLRTGLEELPLKSESRKSGVQKGPSSRHGAGNDKKLNEENRKDVELIQKTSERPKSQIERTENLKPKVQENIKNGDGMLIHAQKPILEFDLQKAAAMKRRPVAVNDKHETGRNGNQYQKEQENGNDMVTRPRSPKKHIQKVESPEPYMIQKSSRDTKHGEVDTDRNLKNLTRLKITRTSEMMIQRNPLKHDSSAFLQLVAEKSPSGSLERKSASQGYLKIDTNKVATHIPPIALTKPWQIPSAEKLQTNKVRIQQQEKPMTINESRTRKVGSTHVMDRPSKLQSSVFGRISKTKVSISIKTPMKKKNDHSPTSCNPRKEDHKRPEEEDQTIAPVSNANSPYLSKTRLKGLDMDTGVSSEVSAALRQLEVPLEDNSSLKSNFQATEPKGPEDIAIVRNSHTSLQPGSYVTKPEYKERHREHENHLKQVLIKSPHFLNFAKALFKLHISVDILHASNHKSPDRDSKILLDCAYETMKRKARRKELDIPPVTKTATMSMAVKTLDELVKELDDDLDQLKFHGCSGGGCDPDAGHLYRILEADIQSRNPDINCMWDFGWKCEMLAVRENDVVREVEKLILEGLINEITRDILHAQVSLFQKKLQKKDLCY